MDILTAPLIDFAGMTLTRAELVGFVAALASLGLAVRRDLLTFPAGMVAHGVALALMIAIGAYAQAVLQIGFIALAAQGWWVWSRHREASGRIVVTRMGQVELVAYPVATLAAAIILWPVLAPFGGGNAASALMLAGSVAAQLLLNFRRVESWLFRIAVDVVALPVFAGHRLWIQVAFHLIFIALAVKGWLDWRRALAAPLSPRPATP